MSRARIAVLQFPGLNCELETQRVIQRIGLEAEIIRWNRRDAAMDAFAGYVIPGGFSYQDRVRAGVIAAKSPLLELVVREVEKGKPILGICNGAQILVEAGLAPGAESGRVDVALARNRVSGWDGYHARWIFVRAGDGARCFFTEGLKDPLPMPVAHAEGRFLSDDPEISREIERAGRQALLYCDAKGERAESFPANPNGSPGAVAGLAGLDGQVLAFMPHPERASTLLQVPEDLPGVWGERRRAAAGNYDALLGDGPGMQLIRAFARLQR